MAEPRKTVPIYNGFEFLSCCNSHLRLYILSLQSLSPWLCKKIFLIHAKKKPNLHTLSDKLLSDMGLFLSRNLTNIFFPFISSKRKQLETVVSLVSRSGRQFQRYDKAGCRLVVGCIPFRYKTTTLDGGFNQELEVLVISSQKGQGMLFPKGGWELDESMEQAALRETIEEAGVVGNVESRLGKWQYESKSQGKLHEGYMFSLLVKQQLDLWPEMNTRKRRWMTVDEAKEVCPHAWMKEALDVLVRGQAQLRDKDIGNQSNCI